jgi:NifU-like protein
MWNYSQKMMDHFLNPRNAGEVESADASGQVGNLVCGDSMKLTLKIDKDTQCITEAKFLTFGCASAIASASALTELVQGKTVDEALKITDDDIANFLEGLPPEKMHCSVLGADALRAAIAGYRGETPPESVLDEKDIVCHCFGVTRQKIEDAVRAHGLTTVDEVTNYTKAGGGCGKCKDRIAEIIASVRGEARPARPERPSRMTNLERIKRIEESLEKDVRPALRADGGDIELIDVEKTPEGPRVTVSLQGRCAVCSSSGVTLRHFVEQTLRERVDPEIHVVEEEAVRAAGEDAE